MAQLIKNAGVLSLIPGLGRSPGEGKGYSLQCSDLENSTDCIVHGVTKSRTQLSDFHFHAKSLQFHLTVCDPMECSPLGSSLLGDSPDKITGVGCHALLQGIFPTQGLKTCLQHCRQILYQLSHEGSPYPGH